MAWKQLELTAPHLAYTILSGFLVLYALFSTFVRDRLHLSEPPLATLVGIIFGPRVIGVLDPKGWGLKDDFLQEFTRLIVGIQCFAVGVELPKHWFSSRNHRVSVLVLLGPVMTFGWLVCALFIHLLFHPGLPTSLAIAACLTPTDPVLAASILSNSQFSTRIPARIRNLLSAESGCNDGISFPFLYVGLSILTRASAGAALQKWFLITVLWQCALGTLLGAVIGYIAHALLKFSSKREMVGRPSYLVFYLLLAIFCIGVASTLGVDDFLVAFTAGAVFSRDGWFAAETSKSNLANVLDLLINSSFFVYFGASIPWNEFNMTFPDNSGVSLSPWRLAALLVLVLALRRLPIVLMLKKFIPVVRTWPEAVFCGYFGPMGVGALFLAIEARAQLENDTSLPDDAPPPYGTLPEKRQRAVAIIWPIICFVVLGSIFVHGLSTLLLSVGISLSKPSGERAPLLGAETDRLDGMASDGSDEE